jgi:hypothetical protein
MKRWAIAVMALLAAVASAMSISFVSNNGAPSSIQIMNVGSGRFNANNAKNFQYDLRQPFIDVQGSGPCRNIYAPSVVQNGPGCYNVYFGGWDGTPLSPQPYICHDQVSVTVTEDNFATMNPHYLIVGNGPVNLLNNPNVIRYRPSSSGHETWAMVYTQLPYSPVLNKPGISHSSDGVVWSPGQGGSFLNMSGYPNGWANADVNGGNVLATEDEGTTFHLFFIDFKHFPGIYHATSQDLQNFYYRNVAVANGLIVNDVKKINGQWVMAMHENGANIYISYGQGNLSSAVFSAPVLLLPHFSSSDEYIVSVSLVVEDGERLMGVLYGATSDPRLTGNAIYAAWLQLRVLFKSADNTTVWGLGDASRGVGPTMSIVDVNEPAMVGRFWVYEADYDPRSNTGSLMYVSDEVTVRAGDIWQLQP